MHCTGSNLLCLRSPPPLGNPLLVVPVKWVKSCLHTEPGCSRSLACPLVPRVQLCWYYRISSLGTMVHLPYDYSHIETAELLLRTKVSGALYPIRPSSCIHGTLIVSAVVQIFPGKAFILQLIFWLMPQVLLFSKVLCKMVIIVQS